MRAWTVLKWLGSTVLDLVYPPLCLICEETLEENSHICHTCLDNFSFQNFPHESFSVSGRVWIDEAWALFDFDENCQKLMHELKYSGKRKAVLVLLEYYRSRIMGLMSGNSYDLIIPVPLHKRKERERGYNQVEHVCQWLAHLLKTRVASDVVSRVKYTKTQTKLSAEERETNMMDAFRIESEEMSMGSRVLIVDDVITTGATSNTLAAVLKQAGAAKVDLISLSSPK